MELRHLLIHGYRTFIQLTPKRGICTNCDGGPITTTQTLDWYDRNARQTRCYGLKSIKRYFQRINLDTEGSEMFQFSAA